MPIELVCRNDEYRARAGLFVITGWRQVCIPDLAARRIHTDLQPVRRMNRHRIERLALLEHGVPRVWICSQAFVGGVLAGEELAPFPFALRLAANECRATPLRVTRARLQTRDATARKPGFAMSGMCRHWSPEARRIGQRIHRRELVHVVLPRDGVRAKAGERRAHPLAEIPAGAIGIVCARAQTRDAAARKLRFATDGMRGHEIDVEVTFGMIEA
jgi:hypothetical protein